MNFFQQQWVLEPKERLKKLMDYVKQDNTRKFNEFFDEIVSKSKKSNVNLKTLVNIDAPNIWGNYLITEAARKNNLIIVKRLIKQQANVSLRGTWLNGNALHYACMNNNSEMCELIMMHGGDPNIVAYGRMPLTEAAFYGNLIIMKYLFNDEKIFKCCLPYGDL